MILADTSVWVDHLRSNDARMASLLSANQILVHPFVTGEIAMGNLRQRATVLGLLDALPATVVATDAEVRLLIERASLSGLGIGYIDAHLLAAARLTPGARLWTRDKRLADAAMRLSLSISPQ